MSGDTHVIAVCVTFESDPQRLAQTLNAARPQVQQLLVVDNSPAGFADNLADVAARCDAEWLSAGGNIGLAAALNVGIRRALHEGASHVLLLDHDSVPEAGMVDALLAALEQHPQPGAAGPVYQDETTGRRAMALRFVGARFERETPGQDVVESDMLITSGSLISAEVLERVGLMDDTLFIDHIDTDWVFRARQKGLSNLMVPAAGMRHQLGDRCVRFGGRSVVIHSPGRLYYIVRNSLLLQRRPHAPGRWLLFDWARLLAIAVVHLAAGPARLEVVRGLTTGFVHGIAGRSGEQPRKGR